MIDGNDGVYCNNVEQNNTIFIINEYFQVELTVTYSLFILNSTIRKFMNFSPVNNSLNCTKVDCCLGMFLMFVFGIILVV